MSDDDAPAKQRRYDPGHLGALWRFAILNTLLTVLGHTVLGFEQSYVQPVLALATAYSLQLTLEMIDACTTGRTPRYAGGPGRLVEFLLSAHIPALSISMLLYFSDRLWVVAFAAAVAIGSKFVFRAPLLDGGTRHFFNPSNFAITVTLLAFPGEVGLTPPWHFTAGLGPAGGWMLTAFFWCAGTFINGRFTKRLPLIAAFLVGFVLQAVARSLWFGVPLAPALAPATGVPAVIFIFYMAPDPGTSPRDPRAQILFGGSIAAIYGLLVALHIPFGLFFALTIVCALRGTAHWLTYLYRRSRQQKVICGSPSATPAT
jgi:enediyne biosynthesis protein E5